MARILITGGCGYIGSHICLNLLEQDHELIVFDNVSAYSGPFYGDNTVLFTLNEGTKAQLSQEQGEWFEIAILNDGKAWVPKEKIRIL